MAFVAVAKLADIPHGRGLRVSLEGIIIGLFRVADTVYAMEDQCPHADAPLSDGCLDGAIVTCALHGWRFDVRTGFRPDDADGFPIPCFATQLRGEWVAVDLQHSLNAPPSRLPRE